MKKTVIGLILILGLTAGGANAQKVTGGLKANANMSNFILSDINDLESKMKAGGSLGGFVTFDLGGKFALQPELLLNMNSSEFKNAGVKGDFTYWGLEAPIYLLGKIDAGDDRVYLGVGPYIGLGLSAQNKVGGTKYNLYEKNEAGDMLMQRFDFGFGAMATYEFNFGMFISGSYRIGVVNALDSDSRGKMLPQTVSVGIGYKF